MAEVLVVDDEAMMRKLIKKILSDKYEIVGDAKDGREALKKIDEEDPDVITLDIQMPKKDGQEVLAEIKEEDGSKKVVLVSVVAPYEDESEELKEKADAYLVKPIKKEELLEAFEEILEEDLSD